MHDTKETNVIQAGIWGNFIVQQHILSPLSLLLSVSSPTVCLLNSWSLSKVIYQWIILRLLKERARVDQTRSRADKPPV